MKSPSHAHFLRVVGLHPPYALVLLAVVVAMGIATTRMSPGELDSGLGMLLFAQMFLASTGFLGRARRGHFDPILIGDRDRTRTLVWHWIVSVAPGALGWTCLAGAGYFMGSPAALSALAGHRAVALLIVSVVAWAGGFTLARGAAGVMWIAALLAILLGRADLVSQTPIVAASSRTVLRQAATLVLCPFLLVGNHPAIAPEAVFAAALLSAAALLLVWRLSHGLNIYLVDRT
jgi:hypothetical protein